MRSYITAHADYKSLHLGHHILAQPEIIFPPFSRSRCAPGGPSNHTSSFSAGSLPLITELGAGTGFLSILLAQLEVNVMATDLGDTSDEHWRQTPLTRLRSNVKLSKLALFTRALSNTSCRWDGREGMRLAPRLDGQPQIGD